MNLDGEEFPFSVQIHKNIVEIFEIGKEPPRIRGEYCPNGDLAAFFARYSGGSGVSRKESAHASVDLVTGRYPADLVTERIGLGYWRAMDWMWGNNFVFLDPKDENILLGYDYEPKLTDFGLSRAIVSKKAVLWRTYGLFDFFWLVGSRGFSFMVICSVRLALAQDGVDLLPAIKHFPICLCSSGGKSKRRTGRPP